MKPEPARGREEGLMRRRARVGVGQALMTKRQSKGGRKVGTGVGRGSNNAKGCQGGQIATREDEHRPWDVIPLDPDELEFSEAAC